MLVGGAGDGGSGGGLTVEHVSLTSTWSLNGAGVKRGSSVEFVHAERQKNEELYLGRGAGKEKGWEGGTLLQK